MKYSSTLILNLFMDFFMQITVNLFVHEIIFCFWSILSCHFNPPFFNRYAESVPPTDIRLFSSPYNGFHSKFPFLSSQVAVPIIASVFPGFGFSQEFPPLGLQWHSEQKYCNSRLTAKSNGFSPNMAT